MGVPTLHAGSAYRVISGTNSSGGTLPTRTNNDVLLAFVALQASGKTFTGPGGGWTAGPAENSNMSSCMFWRIVDGTEAWPSISWTGSTVGDCVVISFSGNVTPSPIGATNSAGGSGTSCTAAGLTSTGNNSLVVYHLATGNNQTIGIPVPYTNIQNIASGNISDRNLSGTMYVSGTTSDAIAQTITSANWSTLGVEILGSGTTANQPAVIVTGVCMQVLRGVGLGAFVSVTETLASADTVSETIGRAAAVTETATLADHPSVIAGVGTSISESMALTDHPAAAANSFDSLAESMALADTSSEMTAANATVRENIDLTDSSAAPAAGGIVLTTPLVVRNDYLYSGLPNYFDPANAVARVDLNLDKLRKFPGKN